MSTSIQIDASPIFLANKLALSRFDVVVNQGGTRSGKTYNILALLDEMCRQRPGLQVSVVSQSIPHLKKGAIKDYTEILQKASLWHDESYNRTDRKYTYPNNSYIEFFSADNYGKVRGPGRDVLFVNEADRLTWPIVRELLLRTRQKTLLDFNPFEPEHWIYEKLEPRPDCHTIVSTYKDNPFLHQRQIAEIERLATTDPEAWKVLGLGQKGTYTKGQIFPDWKGCNDLPVDYDDRFFGLDFGFSNDPLALVEVRKKGNALYCKELVYETGFTDSETAIRIKSFGITRSETIYADSAEPKSIVQLNRSGLSVIPQVKGADSVANGIRKLKEYEVYLTHCSLNFWKEQRYYRFEVDATEKPTGRPIDDFNHCIDALRGAVQTRYLKPKRRIVRYK